jgi:hypothetical protein
MAFVFLGLIGAAAIFTLVGVILLTIAIGICVTLLLVQIYQSKYIRLLIYMLSCFRGVVSFQRSYNCVEIGKDTKSINVQMSKIT